MKSAIGFLVIFTLVVSGCASVGVTHLREDLKPKEENCRIQIYTNSSEIKAPFEEVCLIDSRTGTTAFHTKTASAAIEQAKADACKCGADAMIVTDTKTDGASFITWGMGSAIIKAIRFK